MKEAGLRPELDARLINLARAISELSVKASRAEGIRKIELMAEVEQLELQRKNLQVQANRLGDQGQSLRSNTGLGGLVDRLLGSVRSLISSTDSDYGEPHSGAPHSWS
jgi:hypothetical protein